MKINNVFFVTVVKVILTALSAYVHILSKYIIYYVCKYV